MPTLRPLAHLRSPPTPVPRGSPDGSCRHSHGVGIVRPRCLLRFHWPGRGTGGSARPGLGRAAHGSGPPITTFWIHWPPARTIEPEPAYWCGSALGWCGRPSRSSTVPSGSLGGHKWHMLGHLLVIGSRRMVLPRPRLTQAGGDTAESLPTRRRPEYDVPTKTAAERKAALGKEGRRTAGVMPYDPNSSAGRRAARLERVGGRPRGAAPLRA
jgi:hypothetical protein